jgi:hypothetical protein
VIAVKILGHRERCAGCKGYIDEGEHIDCLKRLPDDHFEQQDYEIKFVTAMNLLASPEAPQINVMIIDPPDGTPGTMEVQLTYKYYYK